MRMCINGYRVEVCPLRDEFTLTVNGNFIGLFNSEYNAIAHFVTVCAVQVAMA